MGGYAWVTLATNNSYSLGALVLAHSLKKANTAHKLAVLITPAVSETMRDQLRTVFDVVKMVDVLDSKDEAHLALMKRPDLGITFTKIHCWRLVEFEKCVFLDADTLVVRNCDELFEREEFSAAPDVSWPDCFNSGVFVYRPSVETFNKLLQFAVENRSFDGGDQGLLNQFFSDWATEDIKKHLPFVYNLTSIAAYSYIPAFKHYGSETRIVHFIGTGKPWLQQLDAGTRTVTPTSGSEHLAPLLQQWWDLFCEKVHPNLDKNLESNNDGMPHPPVEACSNSLAIALTDEPQTSRLTEPCTPYREKDDFRQYNLPYQPFDVKGSSGELLNVEFLLSSVSSEQEESFYEEEPRREEDKTQEVTDFKCEEGETGSRGEETEYKSEATEEQNDVGVDNKPEELEEEKKVDEGQKDQQEEPPPPKDPFDYNSFFPDETCVSNYLEQNVVTYQPFENPQNHNQEDAKNEQESEQPVPPLPRFLTIPENDRRQSGNVEANTREECEPPKSESPKGQLPEVPQQTEPPRREPTPPREESVIVEKRELGKSKSMPYLPSDSTETATETETEETPPRRSIWKSQPNVNVDPNRKYSMPKLKPLLPKQNSFSKAAPFAMPKVTLYTEFLMSSEYKDPVDLPKDKVGFVESHIHKEAKLRRCKSQVDIRSKFGPLPYALSPEVEKPVVPKKFPARCLDNELYDLAQCKRQLGNKPKPKDSVGRKENVRPLPALRPPKDNKSTLIKKRKSKELSPSEGGREKMLKREPKIARERRREPKLTPRNISTKANESSLDEILQRLREFSKDYQHFFGMAAETKRKTVECKNTAVQANQEGTAECSASEAHKILRREVTTKSKETQTAREENANEFRQFRTYIRDKSETSKKGLLGIKDILSEKLNSQESEGNSNPDNRIFRTETLPLQRVADNIPTHSTDSRRQSCTEDDTASTETENSNFTDGILTLGNRNSSEHNLSPAQEQTKESQTNVPTLDDNNKELSLSFTETQPTGSDVQIPNLNHRSRRDGNLSPVETQSLECNLQIPALENCNNSEQSLEPTKMQPAETEVKTPTQDISSTKQGLIPAEEPSKEPEINSLTSEDQNKKEESSEQSEVESKEQMAVPVESSSTAQDFIPAEVQLQNSEINTPSFEDQDSRNSEVMQPLESDEKIVTLEKCSSTEQSLGFVDVQPAESENQEPPLANCSSAEQNLTPSETQEPETFLNVGDQNSRMKSLELTEIPSEESEVQIPTLGNCSNAEHNLIPSETQEPETFLNVGDQNISEKSLEPAKVNSEESEIQTPIESHNSTEQSLRPVEVESKELEPHSKQELSNTHPEYKVVEPSTNATADTAEPEVTKSEETDSNPSDSNAIIQTPENNRRETSEVVLNSTSDSTESEENNTKEHSSKHSSSCDYPPSEEQQKNNPEQQTSNEVKATADEVQKENVRIRGSSEEVAAESHPVTTSPAASSQAIIHNGHKSSPEEEEEPRQKAKEKPAKGVKAPKNPNEILCVPDFETPRSSRVALPTSRTEEMKTTCPTADTNGFGDSPAGTCRFVGKKKSGRKSPSSPKPSTPVCGNPLTGSFEDLKRGSGIAGAIAQLSLEAGQTPESAAASAAHQEYLRRQNWETGNMDYMGRDSFDNIWSKICQTLEAKEAEEAAAAEGSPKEITTEEKKPETNAPTEVPMSLSTILQKCPEYIETLPGDPAAGPVEDDEIIFSKPDSRQPCLTNVVEDDKVRKESSEAAGTVKLSDILQPGVAVGGEKISGDGETKPGPEKSEIKAEPLSGGESKTQQVATPRMEQAQTPAQPTGEKIQPPITPAGGKVEPPLQAAEEKSEPPAQSAEQKPQVPAPPTGEETKPPVTLTGEKTQPPPQPTEEKQPSATPAGEKAESVVAPAEGKPTDHPQAEKPEDKTPQTPTADGQKKAGECTTVAIPSPPIVFPGAPFAEKEKPGVKSKKSEDKPEVVSEPIPLPPPESPTVAPPQEPTAKTSEADCVKDEGKQKKGVFTKILEMVGVAPKEKNGSDVSKSVFYDVEKGAEEAKEIEQASEVKVKSEIEVEKEKKSDPEEQSTKSEELPPSKAEDTKSETVPETKAEVTPQEEKSQPGQEEKEKKAPMPKPERNSQEGKKSADSIQVSSARKSPSPKLTMPQKPPETAVIMPTPPPQPDVPPRKNSGLLKVDETILETPPVTDAAKQDVAEAAKGKVDDIIGKAKSEVESLLQDRRSSEKEAGESADLINTMKLMVGAEQAEKAAPEEVEELRVTTEEERKRHKGEVVTSKLSDQILKAIPPPRRKAISEASASTSAIPKGTAAPEQKTPPGDAKTKPAKPSSIPVPPPRSRGKPTQPSPPKGKGKK